MKIPDGWEELRNRMVIRAGDRYNMFGWCPVELSIGRRYHAKTMCTTIRKVKVKNGTTVSKRTKGLKTKRNSRS